MGQSIASFDQPPSEFGLFGEEKRVHAVNALIDFEISVSSDMFSMLVFSLTCMGVLAFFQIQG